MNQEIIRRLVDIEKTYGVKIIYAVESGSRVWGFESIDSDYDVRFIYIRPLAYYLSVIERRDVIERPDKVFDLSGWDLKKALALMGKSNPPLIEWLWSPIKYIETDEVQELRTMANAFFNPKACIYHYLHMANGNYRDYLKTAEVQLKKYFYVIRPLLCCKWIKEHHSIPPVKFSDLEPDWTGSCKWQIEELLAKKKLGMELSKGPRCDSVNEWIDAKIEEYSGLARMLPKNNLTVDDLHGVFAKMVLQYSGWMD